MGAYLVPTAVISVVISVIGYLLHRSFIKVLDKLVDKVSDHDIKIARLETNQVNIRELVDHGKAAIR